VCYHTVSTPTTTVQGAAAERPEDVILRCRAFRRSHSLTHIIIIITIITIIIIIIIIIIITIVVVVVVVVVIVIVIVVALSRRPPRDVDTRMTIYRLSWPDYVIPIAQNGKKSLTHE